MWTYIVRRLLLMIPTLFGVTVVTFVIMQPAPGDPLLAQLDQGGSAGQSSQVREAYLLQKRDLKLDLPLMVNLRDFHDYGSDLRAAAWVLGATQDTLAEDLAALAAGAKDPASQARLRFLRSLPSKGFDQELQDPDQRAPLAKKILSYTQVFCEDLGRWGVPAAMELLESNTDRRQQIGAIRELVAMAPDPFAYTFSRTPLPAEAAEVVNTWRIWWNRAQGQFEPLEPEKIEALSAQLHELGNEPSREKVLEHIEESFEREDTPFFIEALQSDRPLAERAIVAACLRLFNNRPLVTDVKVDATDKQLAQVRENWQAYYEMNSAQYHPTLGHKLWDVFADTQYGQMVWRLITFDFGRSALKTRDPVIDKIWNAVVISAPLMFFAELLIYGFSIPLGVVCAVNRGRWADRLISLVLFLLYSMPAFVAGMLMLLFLCYGDYLKIFPMERLHAEDAASWGWWAYATDYAWHAFLPVTCLSLFSLASMAMYTRASVLDVLQQDYVRTARAKGLSQSKVVLKHVLRNSLISVITLFSNFLPAMLGGSVLIEYLFNIPGMGRLGLVSIEQKDIPTVMALIYIDAIVVLVSILLTDLLYVIVDPRISFEGQGGSK